MEAKKNTNFHQIAEERKELRKAVKELGNKAKESGTPENNIYSKHYKKPLEEANVKAAEFKVSDFKKDGKNSLDEAKKFLREQKLEHEKELSKNLSQIDYEDIFKKYPKVKKVLEIKESIQKLKFFRMRRMLENLNSNILVSTKERNAKVFETILKSIKEEEKKLKDFDNVYIEQAYLVELKENLAESGHICITSTVAKHVDAIADRMLTGKPLFAHGPTGSGKTSLFRYTTKKLTGKDPEMVYCNPQTRESNVWSKMGIRPTKDGAIETVEIYGPLAKAMAEGKPVIFDEFTALPKEQMVFIKGVFSAKIGDRINIVGNGIVKIQPGFQMLFSANLKSEKNPERQELPPEIAREFEQNNVFIDYNPSDEAYDIARVRLMNKDGSSDMSYHDFNITLPIFLQTMEEIQESYKNKTKDETSKRIEDLANISTKIYSLIKFVMTQGSVEAILSSWMIEKNMKKSKISFVEFLDQRLKVALTFEEYPKADRILAAKILASRGFLTTLTEEDLGFSKEDKIFEVSAIKEFRNKMEDLKKESKKIKHLSFHEVASLDPFNKGKKSAEEDVEELLPEGEKGEEKFIDGKISADYTHPDGRLETISLDIEEVIASDLKFYKDNGINIPSNFENEIREKWKNNRSEIEKDIKEKGFNKMLIVPPVNDLADLADKMKMENGYYFGSNFEGAGGFSQAISEGSKTARIILTYDVKNLKDRPETEETLNTKGEAVNFNETVGLDEYLILQKRYFAEKGEHLDEEGWTWIAARAGSLFVLAAWNPDNGKLHVDADVGGSSNSYLGVSRSPAGIKVA